MAKTQLPGDFVIIIEQNGRKMAFSSGDIDKIKYDGSKLKIDLKEPKYQIDYTKYLSLLTEGADPAIKEAVMSGVRSGSISIV